MTYDFLKMKEDQILIYLTFNLQIYLKLKNKSQNSVKDTLLISSRFLIFNYFSTEKKRKYFM